MQKVYVEGMQGIGDNIFQRPFVKALARRGNQVWIKTSLPEFYADIPGIHFVKSNTTLRTQQKNESRTELCFENAPTGVFIRKKIFYGNTELQKPGGIFAHGRIAFGVQPEKLDLPSWKLPDIGIRDGMKIALIRPTTERKEWHHSARGPLNAHVSEVAMMLREKGYFCISVADLQPGHEWIPDEDPFADLKLHRGELTITQLMALVERADIVVSGSCLISQASFAYRRPLIFLGGGCGGSNHHTKVTDESLMDLSRCLFLYPDKYCMCQLMKHNCDKRISNLREKVKGWLDAQGF